VSLYRAINIQRQFIFINRYYGCGLVFPPKLEGCRVLDLGCGAGRDVYILSSLVGEQGYVVGVDMTKEQVRQNLYQ
jgi:ubiquinone/menaquinone biosynthesis C-methylase UbiE